MAHTFYDSGGSPIAYTDDDEHIYTFDGEPVAYIADDSVHAFSGKHLGWLHNGWIRDHGGQAALFSDRAQGGPMKPMTAITPIKAMKAMRPMKGMREIRPMRPMDSLSWSSLSGRQFFYQ